MYGRAGYICTCDDCSEGHPPVFSGSRGTFYGLYRSLCSVLIANNGPDGSSIEYDEGSHSIVVTTAPELMRQIRALIEEGDQP